MPQQSLVALDLATVAESYASQFPMYQVLDPHGEIVDADAAATIDDDTLVGLMTDMVWAQAFDERMIVLNRQGTLGNYAPAGGQEASQFATLRALEEGDFLAPTYRDLAPLIGHGLPMYQAFMWWKGHMGGNDLAPDLQAWIPQVIVGGSLPHVAGVALGKKLNGSSNVVMSYCGDGATSQGDFYEGLNFAGVFSAPLIAVVQNNLYAISVPLQQQTAAKTLAQKAVAVGIPGIAVDGMDPLALYLVTRAAREYAVAGNGPVLIESLTYRTGSHTMSDDPKRYRTDDEVAEWSAKSPLLRMRTYLTGRGLWEEEREADIAERVRTETKNALTQMGQQPDMKVSDLLKVMFEVAPQNIREQIAAYEAKGN